MTDDIRQQLEDAWPGEWDEFYTRDVGYGASVSIGMITTDRRCQPRLYYRVSCVWESNERMSIPEAARALRARAEILVDALERMEALDDDPGGLAALVGQWPGDEMDEEINEALEDLS